MQAAGRRGRKATFDIYDHEGKLAAKLENLEKSNLPAASKDAVVRFVNKCAADGLSLARRSFYASYLRGLAEMMGPAFTSPTRPDIEKALAEIESRNYEMWTKVGYRVTIKKFYKWLLGNDEELPPEVRWVKIRKNGARTLSSKDLLTREEIRKLLQACRNDRDRAMVSLLADSCCRPGEILTLRIGDVKFDEYGLVLIVHGGKGERRVRVVGESIAHVAAWLQVHPARDDHDAPLFVGMDTRTSGRAMNYAQARKVILSAQRRAGVKKRVFAYLFRHTGATELASQLPEAALKAHMGWVPGSDMAKVYVHLSGRDVDRAILKAKGIEVKEEKRKEQPVRTCARCTFPNIGDATTCRRCGLPLDEKTALEIQDRLQTLDDAERAIAQDPVRSLAALFECLNLDVGTVQDALKRLSENASK